MAAYSEPNPSGALKESTALKTEEIGKENKPCCCYFKRQEEKDEHQTKIRQPMPW